MTAEFSKVEAVVVHVAENVDDVTRAKRLLTGKAGLLIETYR